MSRDPHVRTASTVLARLEARGPERPYDKFINSLEELMSKFDPQRVTTAVLSFARMSAKRAVLAELRAKGLHVADYSAREISERMDQYFAQHMEPLITDAAQMVATSPSFARWRSRASVRKDTRNRTLLNADIFDQRTTPQ